MALSEVAAVLIFPASATALALRQLRTALSTLAELNRRTWEHSCANELESGKPTVHKPAVHNPRSALPRP